MEREGREGKGKEKGEEEMDDPPQSQILSWLRACVYVCGQTVE